MNVRFIVELTDTDRKPYQLLDEIRIPVRAKPGQVARIDYEYPGTTRGGGGTRSAGSAGSASCAAADASTIRTRRASDLRFVLPASASSACRRLTNSTRRAIFPCPRGAPRRPTVALVSDRV